MGRLGVPELILILGIALILFGANKLPQIGRSLALSIREFKKALGGESEGPSSENAYPQSIEKKNKRSGKK